MIRQTYVQNKNFCNIKIPPNYMKQLTAGSQDKPSSHKVGI